MSNRKKMAVMNVFSAIMYYVANSIIGFINRKVFTVYLGSELLGLNGLVVSVISMLSLLELGVASSIGYSLYKPLEEKNYGEVKAIMYCLILWHIAEQLLYLHRRIILIKMQIHFFILRLEFCRSLLSVYGKVTLHL